MLYFLKISHLGQKQNSTIYAFPILQSDFKLKQSFIAVTHFRLNFALKINLRLTKKSS